MEHDDKNLTAREPATADVERMALHALETVFRRMSVLIGENEEVLTATVQKHVVAAHAAAREAITALSRAAPSSDPAIAEGNLPQPSAQATALALTATPDDFPKDSYGLALWLDRALATPPTSKGAVPDGWMLVPVEPTEDMIQRGHQQIDWEREDQNTSRPDSTLMDGSPAAGTTCRQDLMDVWSAMLAAAPKPSPSSKDSLQGSAS